MTSRLAPLQAAGQRNLEGGLHRAEKNANSAKEAKAANGTSGKGEPGCRLGLARKAHHGYTRISGNTSVRLVSFRNREGPSQPVRFAREGEAESDRDGGDERTAGAGGPGRQD